MKLCVACLGKNESPYYLCDGCYGKVQEWQLAAVAPQALSATQTALAVKALRAYAAANGRGKALAALLEAASVVTVRVKPKKQRMLTLEAGEEPDD